MDDKVEYIPPQKEYMQAVLLAAKAQLELLKVLGHLGYPTIMVNRSGKEEE